VSDTRLKLVTIMNYPPDPRTPRMCRVFLDTAIANGAQSITILYEDHEPSVSAEQRRAADIEVVRAKSFDVGHAHFNLRFKLPNLAALDYPFLYLDADMAVLSDLNYLWERRGDKPWVGVDHQWVPSDPRTHRAPFLNSGLQLVGDPAFYDLKAILDVQSAVAPLARAAEFTKDQMFACPGADQAVLFRYFRTIGYDYTHPEIGPGWNSCAGVSEVRRDDEKWVGHTRGLGDEYPVHILHYWSQFKPWAIGCPIYESEEPPPQPLPATERG
jgi:hypothetical protein